MPLNYNLQVDLFDVWGINFMGPFVNSNGYCQGVRPGRSARGLTQVVVG
jgi:hypothetical protein